MCDKIRGPPHLLHQQWAFLPPKITACFLAKKMLGSS